MPTRIILPTPPVRPLSAAEAGAVAKRGRKLLRAGKITHRQLALLDCLLWSCRSPSTGSIVVSYTTLQRLAHMARDTIAGGLRVLEGLGVLTKIRRRIRMNWHQGGTSSRVAKSAYILHPGTHTEFTARTAHKGLEVILSVQPLPQAARMARAALDAVRQQRQRIIEEGLRRGRAGVTPC